MNTKLTEICLGGGKEYQTPAVTALEIKSEGLLCQSGAFSINDWEDDGSLNF